MAVYGFVHVYLVPDQSFVSLVKWHLYVKSIGLVLLKSCSYTQ